MPSSRQLRAISLLFFMTVVVCLIYANVLNGPFILDDIRNIQDNPHLRLTNLTLEGIAGAGFKSPSANRPVANISFALNYYFHKYNPVFYHVVNIVIHITTGFLLFLLAKITLSFLSCSESDSHTWIAFFAALIWLVHPIQTESVSYIVQRMNSMAAMFYVLSLLLYVKARLVDTKGKKWLLFSGCVLSAALAMGSKEIAATLPFFIFLYEWYFFQDLSSTWLKKHYLPLVGILVLFCCLAVFYLGSDPSEKLRYFYGTRDFTLTQRVLTQFRVVLFYLSLLMFPHPSRLNLDHDFPLSHSLFDPATTVITMAAVVGLVGLSILVAKRDRLVSFCILWFLGNLVIESSVIGLEITFEHRTYLPSMFVCLMVVLLLYRVIKPKWIAVVLLSAVVTVCSLWTYERNKAWGNDVILWRDCVKKSPGKARPYNNLGLVLLNRGNAKEAVVRFAEAVKIKPDYADAHNNLGITLADQGSLKEAMSHYYEAVHINPGYADAHYNLGNALKKEGSVDKAITHYFAAVRIKPHFAEAHNNLGVSLASLGRLTEAIGHFSQAVGIKPDHARARSNLTKALAELERIDKDIAKTQKALKRNPENPALHCKLGNLLYSKGASDEAISEYHKALTIDPECIQALYNLAMVYTVATKEYDNARALLQKIIRLRPDTMQAYYGIASLYARQHKIEESIAWLRKAVERGFNNWELLKTDKGWESIRGSSYYQELVEDH